MNYKITDIVAFMSKIDPEEEEHPEVFFDRLRAQFPGVTPDEVKAAFAVNRYEIDAKYAEAEAEYRRSQKESKEAFHIFEGLGKTITLDEAVEIKAQRGDPVALRWQAAMNTRQHRLIAELGEAAHRAHPQFEQTIDHVWHWNGDGDMPSVEALIDWFQMTHPTEACRIEAGIDGA